MNININNIKLKLIFQHYKTEFKYLYLSFLIYKKLSFGSAISINTYLKIKNSTPIKY